MYKYLTWVSPTYMRYNLAKPYLWDWDVTWVSLVAYVYITWVIPTTTTKFTTTYETLRGVDGDSVVYFADQVHACMFN